MKPPVVLSMSLSKSIAMSSGQLSRRRWRTMDDAKQNAENSCSIKMRAPNSFKKYKAIAKASRATTARSQSLIPRWWTR